MAPRARLSAILTTRGPVGDHALCAVVNDLRVCERLARVDRAAHCRRPAEMGYHDLLGVKWSQVQILSARLTSLQFRAHIYV